MRETETPSTKEILEIDKETLIQREEEALSDIPEAKKPKISRLRKALLVMTAGLALMSAAPSFSAEQQKLSREQQIELQIQELTKEKAEIEGRIKEQKSQEEKEQRVKELTGYLAEYFKKPTGITLGEPKIGSRGLMERYGVYINSQHIGDIESQSQFIIDQRSKFYKLRFTKEELTKSVENLFKQKGIELEINKEMVSIQYNILPEAEELLKQWNGSINKESKTFKVGKAEIELTEDTITFSLIKVSKDLLIFTTIDGDGTITLLSCRNGILQLDKMKEVKIEL